MGAYTQKGCYDFHCVLSISFSYMSLHHNFQNSFNTYVKKWLPYLQQDPRVRMVVYARVQPQYNLEAFLTAYINKANCCFLLGANYSPSKGSFLWPDGNAVVYNSWNPGEPGFGLNCSLMTNRKGWGTERCDMERNYICMKKVRQLQDNVALFEYYNMWILISRQFTALSLY